MICEESYILKKNKYKVSWVITTLVVTSFDDIHVGGHNGKVRMWMKNFKNFNWLIENVALSTNMKSWKHESHHHF